MILYVYTLYVYVDDIATYPVRTVEISNWTHIISKS